MQRRITGYPGWNSSAPRVPFPGPVDVVGKYPEKHPAKADETAVTMPCEDYQPYSCGAYQPQNCAKWYVVSLDFDAGPCFEGARQICFFYTQGDNGGVTYSEA